jgi:hypothetical protein
MRKINRTDTELILPTKEVQMVIIFRTILGDLHDKLTGKQSVSNKSNISNGHRTFYYIVNRHDSYIIRSSITRGTAACEEYWDA